MPEVRGWRGRRDAASGHAILRPCPLSDLTRLPSPPRFGRWLRAALAAALMLLPAAVQAASETPAQAAYSISDARSLRRLVAAARRGDSEAELALGLAYRSGNRLLKRNPKLAVRWLRQAARKGKLRAQFELARMEDEGEGIAPDPSDAAMWYRRAAEQGDVRAMFRLGEMLRTGYGVAKDGAVAADWFRVAAQRGDAASVMALGRLYRDGDGVPRNIDEAARWFRRLADDGDAEARTLLGETLLDNGTGEGVPRPPSARGLDGVRWLKAAAAQGYARAQYRLALAHLGGIEADLDTAEAVRLLNCAAEQGYAEALRSLGHIYREGRIVAADPVLGAADLELAAALGSDGAAEERDAALKALTPAELQAEKRYVAGWRADHQQ